MIPSYDGADDDDGAYGWLLARVPARGEGAGVQQGRDDTHVSI